MLIMMINIQENRRIQLNEVEKNKDRESFFSDLFKASGFDKLK
jgi:hypothetical protein